MVSVTRFTRPGIAEGGRQRAAARQTNQRPPLRACGGARREAAGGLRQLRRLSVTRSAPVLDRLATHVLAFGGDSTWNGSEGEN